MDIVNIIVTRVMTYIVFLIIIMDDVDFVHFRKFSRVHPPSYSFLGKDYTRLWARFLKTHTDERTEKLFLLTPHTGWWWGSEYKDNNHVMFYKMCNISSQGRGKENTTHASSSLFSHQRFIMTRGWDRKRSAGLLLMHVSCSKRLVDVRGRELGNTSGSQSVS